MNVFGSEHRKLSEYKGKIFRVFADYRRQIVCIPNHDVDVTTQVMYVHQVNYTIDTSVM